MRLLRLTHRRVVGATAVRAEEEVESLHWAAALVVDVAFDRSEGG